MSKIRDVITAIEDGRKIFEEIRSRSYCPDFALNEIYGSGEDLPENTLAMAENLDYMEYLLKRKDMAGKLQLIYVDPPFFSNSRYQASVRLQSEKLGTSPVIKTGAYDDRWESGMDRYLTMLAVRFMMMRELLSVTGCIWVHLDWHVSHYVKIMLDEIFGEENFINEVCWTYKSGGASKRSFSKKHDTLLFYSKTSHYKFNPLQEKSYNRGLKPYRFKGVKEYQDETGWYTLVNMKDVWSIDMVGRTSGERTGYATQKPEKLLEKIILACSDEGDICADFFSGSGTLGAVAGRLNRRWIMCDEGSVSAVNQIQRLCKSTGEGFRPFGVVRSGSFSQANGAAEFTTEMDCLRMYDYKPNLVKLSTSDEEVAGKYIGEDGISSVAFWSVDSAFDGRIHRASELVRGNDFCRLPEGNLHVIGYDVFGNRFCWEKIV